MKITAHFSVKEFACKDGTQYPAAWVDSRLRPLCTMLEMIRQSCGNHPVTIMSAYRHPAYNRRIGSRDTSQHVKGRAADIQVTGVDPSHVANVARDLARKGLITPGGIGEYATFVHVDTRGKVARWWGRSR